MVVFARVLVLTLALAFPALAGGALTREATPFTASEFAELIERVSEEGGHFWNDSCVSKEACYLHPITKLRALGIQGGVYLGVGPNQNSSYIAKMRPRYT